jgi:heparin binding hemagglutinin HbhA
MPAFPKTQDITKVREQATQAFGGAVEQARTPLLAALGAGDLANQAVVDAVTKVRSQLTERVESARKELPNDFGELRQKADPAELRKRLDDYGQSARKFYTYLAKHGEETFQKLQESPQAKKVREGVDTAQDKVGETVDQVSELADEVLGKVGAPFAKPEESGQAETSGDKTESPKSQGQQAQGSQAQGGQAQGGQAQGGQAQGGQAETKPAEARTSTTTKTAATKSTGVKPAAGKQASTTAKKSTVKSES